jgi:hypothetical protein
LVVITCTVPTMMSRSTGTAVSVLYTPRSHLSAGGGGAGMMMAISPSVFKFLFLSLVSGRHLHCANQNVAQYYYWNHGGFGHFISMPQGRLQGNYRQGQAVGWWQCRRKNSGGGFSPECR